jgi:hypothetical protein
MLGGLSDQVGRCFDELMVELRAIRKELAQLRTAVEAVEDRQPHATLRPAKKKPASAAK